MKAALWLAVLCVVSAVGAARAQDGVRYVVNYIEVLPSSKASAALLLRNYGEASRNEDGNLRFDVLQRIDRPHHFAIVEAWKTVKASEAHEAGSVARMTQDKLKSLLAASFDQRPSHALSVGEIRAGHGTAGRAVYVVTHVDVNSAKKDEGAAALKELADASRKEDGNLRYEVITQSNRPNHFTIVEIWKNQKALEAHESSRHTLQARNVLFPMSGALFDQRLYRPM